MRLCIYSHSIAPSIDGVCRRFTALLTELVLQGHDVLLFTLEEAPEDLPAGLHVVSLLHVSFPKYPDKKVGRPALVNLARVWAAVRKHKPEVIHVTCDALSNTFALVGLLLGVPVVGSFHTDLQDLIASFGANPLESLLVWLKERADAIMLDSCGTTSPSFARKLLAQGISTQFVLRTAVNCTLFSPDKRSEDLRREMTFGAPDALLCVFVGRLSNEKRIEVLVEALKEVPSAYLALVGDGPCAQTYARLHGASNRVYCRPGFRSHAELAAVYASADLHLSASEFETLGNTVLESHACGVPVVVPRTQGFLDTVSDGVDGLFFEPRSVSSLREKVQLLASDKALRTSMGRGGMEAVSDRSISSVVEGLVGWYECGIVRRRLSSYFSVAMRVAFLGLGFPFTVAALAVYDAINAISGVIGIKVKQY